jgi:hypothetical protein
MNVPFTLVVLRGIKRALKQQPACQGETKLERDRVFTPAAPTYKMICKNGEFGGWVAQLFVSVSESIKA